MKNLTKGIAAVGALAMLTGVGACGSNTADDKGQVYFLNNKPEVVNQWNELAEMYTKQTGVKVDIQSATSGSYESTLSSELAKNNAPTMFGIGGFDQYAKYKDYLEPLQDTEAYKLLNDQQQMPQERQRVRPAICRRMVRYHRQQEAHQRVCQKGLRRHQVLRRHQGLQHFEEGRRQHATA